MRGGGSAPTYIYVPGSTYTVHYTTLAVDRKFTIESGKVTNLGLMVYLPATNDPNKKLAKVDNTREFSVITLDNRPAINNFLETNYPEVVRNLKSREIALAPGKYLEENKLPDLRRAIAYHESRGSHVISSPTRTIVYGRAGTIVSLMKQATSDKPQIDVLDTGTLADVIGVARHGEQFTFLTSDAKLLGWDGSNITRRSLPYQVQPVQFQSLGQDGLVAVDNRMRILTSRSINDQWNNYEGAMIKIPRNDMNIVSDSDGAYVTLGNYGFPESVYYLKSGESTPRQINSPDNKAGISTANWNVVVARDSGLFVLFDKRDYFFWSKDKQKWTLYSKPAGTCKPMRIDKDGANLMIECDGIDYRSNNYGSSWTKSTT